MSAPTSKYIIEYGKFSRWESPAGGGSPVLVTKRRGDIVELTPEQAEEKHESVRLATPQDIAAYEARLHGAPVPAAPQAAPVTAEPPAPTPAADPQQPVATAAQPAERHFPAEATAAPAAAPAVPAAPPAAVAATAAAPAPVAPPAPAQAPARGDKDGKPKARAKAGPKARGRK